MPLDIAFNNLRINVSVGSPNQVNPFTGLPAGVGNTISVAPHPNPPRLLVPSPNPGAGIDGEEPTTTSSVGPPIGVRTTSPPCLASPVNLLVPGNPFSSTPGMLGLFGANFPGLFNGPQPPPLAPPPPPPFCPYTSRQQIGHLLFVAERARNRVLVVNSNRFTVLLTIGVPDPTNFAMHPSLRLLAVTSPASGRFYVIDTDLQSGTFGRVLGTALTGPGVAGCAWQPEGEDLLLWCRGDNTLRVVSGVTFAERQRVRCPVQKVVDVAVTMRHVRTDFQTGGWFAFVLGDQGEVAVFESGAPGQNGAFVGNSIGKLHGARKLLIDPSNLATECLVAHRDRLGIGQISRIRLTTAAPGSTIREFTVVQRIGGIDPPPTTPIRDQLSGADLADLAFDDIRNVGALPDVAAPIGWIPPAPHSGKGHAKVLGPNLLPAQSPMLLFVACHDTGTVDVFELASGARLATVAVAGVASLCSYWRQ
ncbi:MAG: hypothetical protein IPK26_03550 [Planctomycetes bacterium]|nr:hypothetical protein [Planctomycetota bacterium]